MKGVDLTRRNDSGPRTEAVDGELVAYGASPTMPFTIFFLGSLNLPFFQK